jgi:hypothetical protein
MRAGYLVECETCDPFQGTADCYEHEGKALCEECYEIAKIGKLERIIGIKQSSSEGMQPWPAA